MEIFSSRGKTEYFSYCRQHLPNKLNKLLEYKNAKKREEILELSNSLEKIFAVINRQSPFINLKKYCIVPVKKQLSLKDKTFLINRIREIGRIIYSKSVNLKYNSANELEYVPKQNPGLSFLDLFKPQFFPWFLIKIKDFSPMELFLAYLDLVDSEEDYYRKILKINKKTYIKLFKLRENKQKITNKQQVSSYCICGRGQFGNMLACTMGEEKCKLNGWVHIACFPELSQMTQEQIEDLEFICQGCAPSQKPIMDLAFSVDKDIC